MGTTGKAFGQPEMLRVLPCDGLAFHLGGVTTLLESSSPYATGISGNKVADVVVE